jgi:hypothetical protein
MAAVASKRSQHGSSKGVPAVAACEGNNNWEVIEAEGRVLNL